MNAMLVDQLCLMDQVFSLANLTWSPQQVGDWKCQGEYYGPNIIQCYCKESKVEIKYFEGLGKLLNNCFSISFLQPSVIVCGHHVNIWHFSIRCSQYLFYRLNWASLIAVPYYHQPWFGMILFLIHLRMQFLYMNLVLIRYVELDGSYSVFSTSC